MGRNALDILLIDDEERSAFRQMHDIDWLLEKYERAETELSLDYRRRLKNGDIIWVRNILRMMREPGGTHILLFEYCYNIEKEKTTEILYNTFIMESYDYVIHINARNQNCMIYMKANDTRDLQSSKVYDSDTFFIKLIADYVHPEDRSTTMANIRLEQIKQNLQSNDRFQFSFRIILKDEILVKKLTAYYLDRRREIIIVTLEDITQIMQEEAEKNALLEAAVNEANKANRAKSDFLSRMSHDMRTPMNAIIGLVDLAKEINNPSETREYLYNIDASSHFLLGLINDVLDLSRIENGKIELWEEPFSIEEFQKGIRTVIKPLLDAKNISFVFDMSCAKSDILVDKLRFNQIFYNLLSNAAKYTQNGGKVELIAQRLKKRGQKNGIRFIIRDNGIGMSEQFMALLFNPFSQERTTFTRELQGSGLGLTIVKNLVEAMGGSIKVNSELGKGSEFIVDLYLVEIDSASHIEQQDSINEEVLQGLRILLVEDNEINIMVAKKMLMRKGCIVNVARNGEEAVNQFMISAIGEFDCVLMDIRMPLMDGLEATRKIRALDRDDAVHIPIVAMTADAFLDDMNRTRDAGMNAHITKPIESNVLFKTIIQCMQQ